MLTLNSEEAFRYVPKRERKVQKEEQAWFMLRPLKARELATIQDEAAFATTIDGEVGTINMRRASTHYKMVARGGVGFGNLDVEFKANEDGTVVAEQLDRFPGWLIDELALTLDQASTVSEDEEKNSD